MTDVIVPTSPIADNARIVFEGLSGEYSRRYAAYGRSSSAADEMLRYPPDAFAPPLGNFLILQREGRTIAAGAFMSHDAATVEIKRIWTDTTLRRQGLARTIMQALEHNAVQLGYTRAYLSTGHLQPEAVGLYRSLGYRALFDDRVDLERYRSLPFEKHIGAWAGRTSTTPIRPPDASAEAAAETVAAIKAEQSKHILARLEAYRARVPA